MSLKCSVFGHQFGDTDITRDRVEQGSEVVITITETETCDRCGETRVVSENKEVTTLETPAEIVGDDLDEEEETEDATTDASGESGPSPAETGADDAELIDEAEEETPADTDRSRGRTTQSTAGDATSTGMGTLSGSAAGEDDAVILDDDSDDEGRAPGEWPQATDEDDDEEWTPETEPGELRPVEQEQPDVEQTSEAMSVPEGEFHCPECEFVAAVESSSLREGDFCPQCHRGTLAHRVEE